MVNIILNIGKYHFQYRLMCRFSKQVMEILEILLPQKEEKQSDCTEVRNIRKTIFLEKVESFNRILIKLSFYLKRSSLKLVT